MIICTAPKGADPCQLFASGDPRVCVAFSVVDSVSTADSILAGNLHNLSSRDPGWYGKGIYLSFDPEYCVRWYGRRPCYRLLPDCDWEPKLVHSFRDKGKSAIMLKKFLNKT